MIAVCPLVWAGAVSSWQKNKVSESGRRIAGRDKVRPVYGRHVVASRRSWGSARHGMACTAGEASRG